MRSAQAGRPGAIQARNLRLGKPAARFLVRVFLNSSLAVSVVFSAVAVAGLANAAEPLLPRLPHSPLQVVSTIPRNGDVNPYGVAFVPSAVAPGGKLRGGDILVSNFNDAQNLQGTGATIVSIDAGGNRSLFFRGKPGLGLTTALAVLRRGVVLVGNLPTKDGTSATVQQGSLIAIDRFGRQIASFSESELLDGPWDLVAIDRGEQAIVFVSNVLNGTVSRLEFDISRDGEQIELEDARLLADEYTHRFDPAAVVLGPTGLAFDPAEGTLYVASTADNAIYAVERAAERSEPASKGRLVYRDHAHLRGPLGLVLARNGDLVTANGDALNGDPNQPSELVEFTKSGKFVAQLSVDLGGQGGAFGLAIHRFGDDLRVAAVDDVANTLKIWTLE